MNSSTLVRMSIPIYVRRPLCLKERPNRLMRKCLYVCTWRAMTIQKEIAGRQNVVTCIVNEELVTKKLMTFNSVTNFEQTSLNAYKTWNDPLIDKTALKNNMAGPANAGKYFIINIYRWKKRQLLLTNNGEQIYTPMQRMKCYLSRVSIRKLMGQLTVQTYPLLQQREDIYIICVTTP